MTSLAALYALFDQFSDGMCLADAAGDVLYMNKAAARILDLNRDSQQLRNACNLLCKLVELPSGHDAKCDCPLRDPEDSTPSVTLSGRIPRSTFNWKDDRVTRNDAWKDIRVRCVRARVPMGGRSEELHVIFIEDGSPEAELKRHREDWRSMIAHDMRQPLSCVYSALKLLEDIHPKARAGQAPDHETTLVETSLRSCRRMMELLDLYLDVARFDAGAMPVKLEPVAVEKVIAEAIEEASARAGDAGVIVEADLEPGLKVEADVELFTRVVTNLLDNAIKYNVKGGSVKLSARRAGSEVRVSFKDTGRGIDPNDLPLIFDRYYQAKARRAGRIKGNGLGLTFVKQAVELMKGELAVSSELGKGTEFVVALKAAGS